MPSSFRCDSRSAVTLDPAGSPDEGIEHLELERPDAEGGPANARVDTLVEKIAGLSDDLRAATADLTEVRKERDRVRAEIERVRGRRAIRVATALGDRGRNLTVRARTAPTELAGRGRSVALRAGIGPPPAGHHRLRASPREAAAIEQAIVASVARDGLTIGPTVSVLVRGSGQPEATGASIRAVRAATYGELEIAVVDPQTPLIEALLAATNEFVLVLHDDVRPIHATALGCLVETLLEAPADVAAVAGRLILPRRPGAAIGPVSEAADLTVAEGGRAFAPANGNPRAVPIGRGGNPLDPGATDVVEVPAASAACMLVRRSSIAGLALDTDHGPVADIDGVEVCLRLREAGQRVLADGRAAFWHEEASPLDGGEMPDGWAPRLFRSVFRDRIEGSGRWSREPFHVAITVTRNDPTAGYGDWNTAHELGDELDAFGWRVTYVERLDDHWYDLPTDVDAILVLLDLYDLRRIPRGIVRIAWIRSWAEHWVERSWFDDYDIVLTTSEAAKQRVDRASAACSSVFPLATNPERFHANDSLDERTAWDVADVAFVGNYFGQPRAIASGLPALAARGHSVRVWGHRWDQVAGMAELTRGPLPYDEVPNAYRTARIVVDDAVDGTREFGLMNSRVFDALAAGALVVTNNEIGARELFDEDFPTWTDPASLADVVDGLLADPARRSELAARYAAVVRERHTYTRRAGELKALLGAWLEKPRMAIALGARSWVDAERWGDLYFARALQREFGRRGTATTVHPHGEWPSTGARADVALHLFGARLPPVAAGQVALLWIISHPDRVTPEMCARYDHLFVASDRFAARLAAMTDTPVSPLHQATDPERFWPDPTGPAHELLFIGSSRGQVRPVVSAAAASGHELAVYGAGWTPELLDPQHVRGEWIPNDQVRRYYSSADVVLADHYADMRDLGFISNRIYDALACGAFVLSDEVPGIGEEFDGAVVACDGPESVQSEIDRYLADAGLRTALARRGRQAVLDRHTFARRVDAIEEIIGPLLAGRRSHVVGNTERVPGAGPVTLAVRR